LKADSQPDALVETETLLLVVEGKRTERKATVATTWMRRRSQMLRHMDAAWEVRGGRRVLGLMIVEGQRGIGATTPTEHWLREADEQVLEQTLTASLPHRTPAECNQIADGFLGVMTWQKLCSDLGLPWPPGGGSDVW